MFLYRFPPHSPQWGLNIGAPAALLVGVSGDGPPYSTPELAKRKEVCGDRRPENDCQIRQPRD